MIQSSVSAEDFLAFGCHISTAGLYARLWRRQHDDRNSFASQTLGQVAARHNIKIGAAADSPYLSDSSYRGDLAQSSSQLQAENEMKFSIIHPGVNTYDYRGGDALVSFAAVTHHGRTRHTWFGTIRYRPWARGKYSASQRSTILQDHITTVMSPLRRPKSMPGTS